MKSNTCPDCQHPLSKTQFNQNYCTRCGWKEPQWKSEREAITDEKLKATRLLIEFARNVEYNDIRYAPKDLNLAADILEKSIQIYE